MIEIHYNGSKNAGDAPDPIEVLYERLVQYTLMPNFSPFTRQNGESFERGTTIFGGNFVAYSGAFEIETDEQSVIDKLFDLIGANMRTVSYKHAKFEYDKDQAVRAKRKLF